MYPFIKSVHSNLAIILLFVFVAAVIYLLFGFLTKKAFTSTTKRVALVGFITAHTQLLIGLLIYFISPLGVQNFSKEAMSNSISRLYILEHPLMMILGIVFITIGYSKAKKSTTDAQKYKLLSIFYSIGLICILSRVPWHVWM